MSTAEILTLIGILASLSVGLAGLIISIRNHRITSKIYKRENSLVNENFIYQEKYHAYQKLFSLGVDYSIIAEDIRICLSKLSKESTTYYQDLLKEKEDEFEKVDSQFESELLKTSIILPEEIAFSFSNLIFGKNPWELFDIEEEWEKNVKHYNTQLDKIHTLITKDLFLAELNDGIVGRLGQKRRIQTESRIKRK